ncbi:hypothetical protein vseg_015505 [Gypsophila vaccaria]
MTSHSNMAIAMSGKTARACDCCVRKRARWYCAADDAFLCQACDGSVHSANPLARRHERVRLKTASLNKHSNNNDHDQLPTWHRGLTRKPRTPRHGKNNNSSKSLFAPNNTTTGQQNQNPTHIVPDLGNEETTSFSSSQGEDEEQLLFRVPEYDPFMTEFCTSSTTNTPIMDVKNDHQFMIKLPSDLELEEFAADVETLLGKGLEDESFGIEELGLLAHSPNTFNNINNNNNNNNTSSINNIDDDDDDDDNEKENDIVEFGKVVKVENNVVGVGGGGGGGGGELINKCEIEIESDDIGFRVPFDLSFDYDFPTSCEDLDGHHRVTMVEDSSGVVDNGTKDEHELCKLEGIVNDEYNDENSKEGDDKVVFDNKRRKILLRLDYEAISEAWASHGTPWMDGQRPDISPDDSWPHCLGGSGTGGHHALYGDMQMGGSRGVGDGGREARVSRYREKRRTRLFSKKIRYEVRKLNAEKRPRMKGRFVKRSSFVPTNTAFPMLSKR